MEHIFLNSKLLISKGQLAKVLSVHNQENIMDFIDLYYDLGGKPGQLDDVLIDRIISHEANDFKVIDLYKSCDISNNATERVRCFKVQAERMKQIVIDQGFKLQSIRSLIGIAGKEILLCGILFKGHGDEPFIEDDTGQLRLMLDPENINVGQGLFFDSHVVLIKGKYFKEGKIFKVSHITHPPILSNLSAVKEREVVSKKLERGYCLFFHQVFLDVEDIQDDFVFTLKKYLDKSITLLSIIITDCFQTKNPQDQRSALIHFVRRIGTELPSLLRDVFFVFVPPTCDILPTAKYNDYVFKPVLDSFDHIFLPSNPCILDCFGRSIALFSYDYNIHKSLVASQKEGSTSFHLSYTIASQMRITCFKQSNMLFSDEMFFKRLPSLIVVPNENAWFEHTFDSQSNSIDNTIVNNTSSFAEHKTWTAYLPYEHKLEFCQLPRKK